MFLRTVNLRYFIHRPAIFYARRTGFWSSYIDGEFLPYRDREEVTIAANAWLENRIRSDETARFDWLWLHRRWYVNRNPRECLNIAGGRSILKKTLEFLGLKEMPRRDRIFIVAPAERSGGAEGTGTACRDAVFVTAWRYP